MSPEVILVIQIVALLSGVVVGIIIGTHAGKPKNVGSLLVLTDPVDGDRYMQLELSRNRADEIYDGNEVLLKVIEVIEKDRSAK